MLTEYYWLKHNEGNHDDLAIAEIIKTNLKKKNSDMTLKNKS